MSDLTDAEIKNMPLDERIRHSFWKARANACEDIESQFLEAQPSADLFADHLNILKTLLEKDKNVVAREKGLAALFVYCDRYKLAKKQVSFITPILLTPDFIGGRLSTQQLCVKILLCLAEIDVPEPVVEALLSATTHKLAKVVAPSIGVIKNIVKTYGTQFFPTKKVLAAMLPWFEHSDKEVRRETYELTQALGHWIGAKAMEKHISTLRDVQVKELVSLLNALPTEPPKAPAMYRSQAEMKQAQQSSNNANAAQNSKKPTGNGANNGSDAKTPNKRERALSTSSESPENESDRSFASAVPVEVLAKIESSQFYEMMASSKWQDRKDHLEILIGVLDVTRMKPGSYHQLGSVLQKGLNDVNVKVVELSAKAIGLLARGLRTGFAPVASWIVPPMLEKFKEKKAGVVQALHEALSFLVPGCLPLADVMELLSINSKVKVPQVKENLLKFMAGVIDVSSKSVLNKQLASLMAIMLPLIDDGDAKVRDGACYAIGRLMAHLGEHAVTSKYLTKVDKSKLLKMTDAAKMPQDDSNTTTSHAASQSDSSTSSPSHTHQDATMDYTAMISSSNQLHPNNTTNNHTINLTASHTANMTGNIPSTTTERRKTGDKPQPRNEYSSKPPNSTHNTGNYDNLIQKSRIGVNGEERKPISNKPETKPMHKTPSPPGNESRINHYANANTPKPVESKAEMMRRQQLERERMEQQEQREREEREARENRMREEQRRQREFEMEEERKRVRAHHEAEAQRTEKLRMEQQLAEQRAEMERLEQRHQLEQQRLEKQIALMKKQQMQQQQIQFQHQQQAQQPASYHPPLSVSTSTSALTNSFGLRSMQSIIGEEPWTSNKENVSSRFSNNSSNQLNDGGMLDLNETFKSLSISSSSSDFGAQSGHHANQSTDPLFVKSTLVSVSSTSVSSLRERLAGLQKKT